MGYLEFDRTRPFDIIFLGRIAIDFNPAFNEKVREDFKPLKQVRMFEMFPGGSPANMAIGVSRHGMKAGFLARVSDDQFGDYVTEYFAGEGIDISHISRCRNGEKLGLTFTEMLSSSESNILMYRNAAADLQLAAEDIDEEYIRQAKALLVSGTALAQSPSREAALKAIMLAVKNRTRIIFDIDYRPYSWKSQDETAVYYAMAAQNADIIMGSREEFDLTERLVRPGMTDRESAAFWHGKGASILVIKHGMEGSAAYTADGKSFRVKPFPVSARKGFGGGDGYGAGFLYGLYQGWDIADCLEFGSAEASMMVRSNNCSVDLPGTEAVRDFIREEKALYGEMVAREDEEN